MRHLFNKYILRDYDVNVNSHSFKVIEGLKFSTFYLPVYGDIFYEVCSLCVCDDDAFWWDGQCYLLKLLRTGSGLWIRNMHMQTQCTLKWDRDIFTTGVDRVILSSCLTSNWTPRSFKCTVAVEQTSWTKWPRKCLEFKQVDRMRWGQLHCGTQCFHNHPIALLRLESQKIWPQCWASSLWEGLLTMTLTSAAFNYLVHVSTLASYPTDIRLRTKWLWEKEREKERKVQCVS